MKGWSVVCYKRRQLVKIASPFVHVEVLYCIQANICNKFHQVKGIVGEGTFWV